MFGYLDDLRHVREMLQRSRVQGGLRAAAVLGSIEAVPHLLALLDHDDSPPEVGVLTRQALTTITGLDFASARMPFRASASGQRIRDRFDSAVRFRYGRALTLDIHAGALRTGPGHGRFVRTCTSRCWPPRNHASRASARTTSSACRRSRYDALNTG